MKRSTIFLMALAVVLYLSAIPAFAQRERAGGSGGRGFSSPRMPGKERRHPGGEMSHPGRGSSKAKEVRGTSNIAGRKTVGHLVTQNTKLSSKLYTLLPAGVDLPYAASGFEHLGQFVAAVHVSHNLSIPFEELKARMVGSSPESLGKAIHELRPDVNASDEVIKANEQALEDMERARP